MANHGNHHKPPQWANWLLERFSPSYTLEEVQGDLQELYPLWIQKEGLQKARQRYIWTVFRLLRPFARKVTAKEDVPPSLFHVDMIRNYFKIAWRTLLNQWQYSLVNITGLAVGMVCCIFILLYVHDKLSYDRYHEGADRIYRITRDDINNAGQLQPCATTPRAMALSMCNDLPEVEAAAGLFQCRQMVMQYEDKQFYEDRVFEADSNLFKVFTFPFVMGSPKEALATPQSMLITEQRKWALARLPELCRKHLSSSS